MTKPNGLLAKFRMVRRWKGKEGQKVNEPFASCLFWQQYCYFKFPYCTNRGMGKDFNIWELLASKTPTEFKCCTPPLGQPRLKCPERKLTWVCLRLKRPWVHSSKFCCDFNQHSGSGVAGAACCRLLDLLCAQKRIYVKALILQNCLHLLGTFQHMQFLWTRVCFEARTHLYESWKLWEKVTQLNIVCACKGNDCILHASKFHISILL